MSGVFHRLWTSRNCKPGKRGKLQHELLEPGKGRIKFWPAENARTARTHRHAHTYTHPCFTSRNEATRRVMALSSDLCNILCHYVLQVRWMGSCLPPVTTLIRCLSLMWSFRDWPHLGVCTALLYITAASLECVIRREGQHLLLKDETSLRECQHWNHDPSAEGLQRSAIVQMNAYCRWEWDKSFR